MGRVCRRGIEDATGRLRLGVFYPALAVRKKPYKNAPQASPFVIYEGFVLADDSDDCGRLWAGSYWSRRNFTGSSSISFGKDEKLLPGVTPGF